MHACVHACIHAYVCVYVCVCACVFMCVCVCVWGGGGYTTTAFCASISNSHHVIYIYIKFGSQICLTEQPFSKTVICFHSAKIFI